MNLHEVLDLCIEKWTAARVELGPPIEEAEIRRVWKGLGQEVSDDVLALYGRLGGFAVYEFDHECTLWSLWPWEFVISENAATPGPVIRFCCHSIQVVTWGLRFEDRRRSSVWRIGPGDDLVEPVAPDLEEFFRSYLGDPWALI